MPIKSKPIQIMILIAVVGVSTLLMYLVTRPRYDQASNTITFLNVHKRRIHTDVNELLREIDTEPTVETPWYHSYWIHSDNYVFSFRENYFSTQVTPIVPKTPRNPVANKPYRTETQLINELAERIGI